MYLDDILAYEPRDEAEAGDKAMFLEYLRLFPDTILTRENKIAHLTASGFVVNGDGTRVLMAHHNLYRVWAWTGGHADGDGDLLSVALREAREETRVEHIKPLSTAIASLDILPVWGHVKRGEWVPSHQHLNVTYLLEAAPSSPVRCKPDENSAVGWFGPADFAEQYNSWSGGAVGPAHTLRQSAFFRGRNQSRKLPNLYYAGGTTVPGVGVPMCLISAHNVLTRMREQ